jgi:hypothetical protein
MRTVNLLHPGHGQPWPSASGREVLIIENGYKQPNFRPAEQLSSANAIPGIWEGFLQILGLSRFWRSQSHCGMQLSIFEFAFPIGCGRVWN